MNNDNVILNDSDFSDGLSSIKLSLDKLDEIDTLLKSIDNYTYGTSIDITNIKKINTDVSNLLKDIYPSLSRTKVKIDDLQDSVSRMRKEEIESINKKIDKIKGLNPDVGGHKSTSSTSLLDGLRNPTIVNRILDTIKGSDVSNAIKSENATGALEMMKNKKGVNIVLDTIKDVDVNTGSYKTTNAVSALSELEGVK